MIYVIYWKYINTLYWLYPFTYSTWGPPSHSQLLREKNETREEGKKEDTINFKLGILLCSAPEDTSDHKSMPFQLEGVRQHQKAVNNLFKGVCLEIFDLQFFS